MNSPIKIFGIQIDPNCFWPKTAHKEDAGYDLMTPVDCVVEARSSVTIDTGVHIEIPCSHFGLIMPKSGLNVNHGILSFGVIDSGYTGSVKVKLYNLSDTPYWFNRGEKVSQIIFIPMDKPILMLIDKFQKSDRGSGGFGSTGK